MEVNRSDVLIYGVFLCSILMVISGLVYLLIGALKVKKKQKNGDGTALAFEFRGIKLRTDFPAIGIAMGGLLFALLAAWMDQNGTMTIHVEGKLVGENLTGVQLFAAVPMKPVHNPGNGTIKDDVTFVLGQDRVYIIPVVPGHQGPTSGDLDPPMPFTRTRRVDVGEVPVKSAAISMPGPSATVVAAPTPEPGSENRKGY
jgi:hypothetical protein